MADEEGQDGGGSGGDGGTGAGGDGKPPVPYAVFSDTNRQLREAQKQLEAANDKLAQFGETRAQLAVTKARASVDLALAKAGVGSDAGRDYLAQRYLALDGADRPELDAWVGQIREDEPAFFGGATGKGGDAGGGGKDKPTTSPDATGDDKTTRVHRPLSAQAIGEMSETEFDERFADVVQFYNDQQRRGA